MPTSVKGTGVKSCNKPGEKTLMHTTNAELTTSISSCGAIRGMTEPRQTNNIRNQFSFGLIIISTRLQNCVTDAAKRQLRFCFR
jgi:hypothetical protein